MAKTTQEVKRLIEADKKKAAKGGAKAKRVAKDSTTGRYKTAGSTNGK